MNETREIIEIMSIGAKGIAYLTGMAVKHLQKIYAEAEVAKEMKLISGQEFDSIDQFLRSVKGDFEQNSIPVKSNVFPKGQRIEEIKKELNQRGITFHVMPDLNKADGKMQLLVYNRHRQKYKEFLEDYFYKFLQVGGKHDEHTLNEFTQKNTSLVNVPFNGSLDVLEKNLQAMKINYALLPDPIPGDNLYPLCVANEDIKKLNLLMEKVGEQLTTDIASAWQEDSYLKTASKEVQDEIKQKVKTYAVENQKMEEISEWLESKNEREIIQKKNNPNLRELSIDIPSLVKDPNRSEEFYHIRFPLTHKEQETTMMLEKKDFYIKKNQRTMVTFLNAQKEYDVFQKGTGTQTKMTGQEISDYFKVANDKMNTIKRSKDYSLKNKIEKEILPSLKV